jgi:hypothetical protein
MNTKNIVIGIAVVGGLFLAYKWYQKRQQSAPTNVTTVNNAAPADSTAQIISSGTAAVNSIVDFFQ